MQSTQLFLACSHPKKKVHNEKNSIKTHREEEEGREIVETNSTINETLIPTPMKTRESTV